MANDDHLAILKKGVEAWNKWRAENPYFIPDLVEVSFVEANLSKADLSNARLNGAKLAKANLSGANPDAPGGEARGGGRFGIENDGAEHWSISQTEAQYTTPEARRSCAGGSLHYGGQETGPPTKGNRRRTGQRRTRHALSHIVARCHGAEPACI